MISIFYHTGTQCVEGNLLDLGKFRRLCVAQAPAGQPGIPLDAHRWSL